MGGAYVEHGETGNIWEVNLKKRDDIWNKCTHIVRY